MPDFSKALNRLRTKTAVATGQSATLTIGEETGFACALTGSSSGLEFGEVNTDNPRLQFLVPWGSNKALPDVGTPVHVTSGQHSGRWFKVANVSFDGRQTAGNITIDCEGENE